MFFRFGSALVLVVITSLLGILVEKHSLTLRREISRQHYRMDVLKEKHARLRLRSQQLAAVERLFETIEAEESGLIPSRPGSLPSTAYPSNSTSTSSNDESVVDDNNASSQPTTEQKPNKADSSDLTTRRVPLLFWQKPISDPRLKRGAK